MNADQVIEGIGQAVAAVAPQEYCLFWSDYWWWMCMTKAEWSGWMQAVGSVAAIAITAFIARKESRIRRRKKKEDEIILKKKINFILRKTDVLNSLEFFCYHWKNYEKFSQINSMPERTKIYPKTSFLVYTKNAFFVLRDAIRSMSVENKEFMLTSDFSYEFGNLYDLIIFYEKMYTPLERMLGKHLSKYDESAIILDIYNNKSEQISLLENNLATFHYGVFAHRDELFEWSNELFEKLDYVAR